jgi:hypothetical protein
MPLEKRGFFILKEEAHGTTAVACSVSILGI